MDSSVRSKESNSTNLYSGCYPWKLRSQGIVKAIGVGMNDSQMELRFAQEGDFDCFLLANGFLVSIVEHAACLLRTLVKSKKQAGSMLYFSRFAHN
jgi:hypothetical protein